MEDFDKEKEFREQVEPLIKQLHRKLRELEIPGMSAVFFKWKNLSEDEDGDGTALSGVGGGWTSPFDEDVPMLRAAMLVIENPPLTQLVMAMAAAKGLLGDMFKDPGRKGWTEDDYKSLNGEEDPGEHTHYQNLPCARCGHPWAEHTHSCVGRCTIKGGCDHNCRHFVHAGDPEDTGIWRKDKASRVELVSTEEEGEVEEEKEPSEEERLEPFEDFWQSIEGTE